MQIECRHLPATLASPRVAARSDNGDGSNLPNITGYGAVYWNSKDSGSQYMLYADLAERIVPGAFDRAIREDDVRALFNHDANKVLGRTTSGTLSLRSDVKGLFYEVRPDPSTGVARDVVGYLQRGDVSGSSFSFIPTDVVWREEGDLVIREVHAVKLFDVGPVTFPAYTSATSGLRSAGGQYSPTSREAAASQELRRKLAHYRRLVRLAELGI
ncbi:MAG TPA: HK97 family phage prohead protease [Pirellulales bacterium]|nr:HK97 family phage prohead protease [Pirellulales bacterium]